MARGTVTKTRGRTAAEAPSTIWLRGTLLPRELLARVLPWSRKKLLFEAPYSADLLQIGHGVELPDHLFAGQVQLLRGRRSALCDTLISPVTSEATSRARRTGRT